MLRILPVAAGVALSLALTCAAQAQTTSAPSGSSDNNWDQGGKLLHQGVMSLNAADKTMMDAARRGVDAMGRRATFGASSQKAADDFHRLAASTPQSADAAEAQRWAATVQAAANQWQSFQAQETDATRDLNAAIQQNSAAQKSVADAMNQIDRGRQMIGDMQPVAYPLGDASTSAAPAAAATPTTRTRRSSATSQ